MGVLVALEKCLDWRFPQDLHEVCLVLLLHQRVLLLSRALLLLHGFPFALRPLDSLLVVDLDLGETALPVVLLLVPINLINKLVLAQLLFCHFLPGENFGLLFLLCLCIFQKLLVCLLISLLLLTVIRQPLVILLLPEIINKFFLQVKPDKFQLSIEVAFFLQQVIHKLHYQTYGIIGY